MSLRCRVFLAGEGPSDIGDLARAAPYRKANEGFLQPVLRRLAGPDLDLEFEGAAVKTLAKARVTTPGGLLRRHAAQAYVLAETEGCAALVFVVDLDKQSGKRASHAEAMARGRDLQASIDSGFSDGRQGGDPARSPLATVIGIPCRMIEAWALGDPQALRAASGREVDASACANPEALWGKIDDPDSRHPKRVIARLMGGGVGFAKIAETADPVRIERACPTSFRPFAKAVRAQASACAAQAARRR